MMLHTLTWIFKWITCNLDTTPQQGRIHVEYPLLGGGGGLHV